MTNFIFEYPDKLQPVFDTKSRYIVLEGGRASSKSHFVARKILFDTMTTKRDVMCLREFQANLKQSNYKLFYNLIEQYKLPFKVYADHFTSLTTGSEIIFKGMNDLTADGIKSYEGFSDAWIEEAHNFSTNSFQKLDPTIRQEDSKIYVTLNPEQEGGDPVVLEIREKYADKALFIHINYIDNPFCPQSIIEMAEACKKNKSEEYNHIWLGQPSRGNQNYVVRNFTSDNIADEINHLPDMPLHIACDFNVDPMAWLCLHIDWDEKKMYYFDEIVVENTDTRECIEEFARRYPPNKVKAGIVINGDASGNNRSTQAKVSNYVQIKNRLKELGYNKVEIKIKAANPPILRRIKAWNDKVLTTQGERDIIISKKCKWLLYNCRNLKFKEGTTIVDLPSVSQMQQNKDMKFLEHPFDAASYPVDYYFPVKMDYS